MEKTRWTLSELADEVGLPARTIRYYIARGLLDGPDVAGRGAGYGVAHRDRLIEIRTLQSEGRMLAEIAQPAAPAALPAAETWQQYRLADGVTVQVRSDLAPWRLKRIHHIIADAAAQLKQEDAQDGNGQL